MGKPQEDQCTAVLYSLDHHFSIKVKSLAHLGSYSHRHLLK